MKSYKGLAALTLAVAMVAGVTFAGGNKIRETVDIYLPFYVDYYGQIEYDEYADGYATIKVVVNTRNGKGHAKARGWVENDSDRRLKLKNDPFLDSVIEDQAYYYFGADIDINRSKLVVNKHGRLRYSNRFEVDDFYGFDT
ncbi:hypothetical protein AB1L42_04270 [Thalassoglobus sp. JC818]|uniref:hypothetical protein n=1 Tax=Thalassoglobus sp. JC818 TaxID=3232136 RepID=UPI00345B3BD2